MQHRPWRMLILVGLTWMSLGIASYSHAAIPDSEKTLFSEAMKANRSGNYFQAGEKLRHLINIRPDWGLVYLQLGILELNINPDPSVALSLLERATELLPSNPRAHFQLGMAHVSTGKCQKAMRHIGRAIELRPKFAQAHQERAACHEVNGDLTRAIESLETLLTLKKRNTAAMAELARLYELTGKPALGESKLRQLIEYEPRVYFHWLSLGYFLRRQGRENEAQEAFNRAERLRPRPQRKMRPLPRSSDLP